MALSITNDSVNNLTITNESLPRSGTWEDHQVAWNEATGTWEAPNLVIAKEAVNEITITNETPS